MFKDDFTKTDLAILSIVSIGLTIPFLFYTHDITKSLRTIAQKCSGARRPLLQKRAMQRAR